MHRLILFTFALLAPLLAACTAIPTQEFAAYRASFAEARKAGEQIMLDAYAVDDALTAQTTPRKVGEWSFKKIEASFRVVDRAAVRLAAWDVVDRYNATLASLASGERAEALGQDFDGLAAAIEKFPFDELASGVASSLGPVGPAVQAIKFAATAAKREGDRRRFVEAVRAARPFMRQAINLLKADADTFYGYHTRVHVRTRQQLRDHLGTLWLDADATYSAAADPSAAPETDPARVEFERFQSLGKALDGEQLAQVVGDLNRPAGVAPMSGLLLAEARRTNDRFQALAASFAAADIRLAAYEDVLTPYAVLLLKLEESVNALADAVENAQPTAPALDELTPIAVAIRKAVAKYEEVRR